jgi:hypothetical protein
MSGSSLCRFVCGMSSKRNTRQTPEEPPVRCHHWTPYSIPLHTALRRFANPFRVASFGRADLTKFPWMSPVTCEGDTALVLADCKGIYLLPDFRSKYPHSAVRANAIHTVRLIAIPLDTYQFVRSRF